MNYRYANFVAAWGELPSKAPHPKTAPGFTTGLVLSAMSDYEAEIELLRKALVQYGDRSRMSWAGPELQPVIDAAFEAQKQEREDD